MSLLRWIHEHARRVIVITAAFVCVVIGFLTVWTPLPTGLPLIAVGIVLLVTVSATARRHLRRARARSSVLDRGLAAVEARTGRTMSVMLKRTRPLARKAQAKSALKAADNAIKKARMRSQEKG